MSSDLEVFKMSYGQNEETGKYTIIFTRIFSCYTNSKLGKEIMEHQFDNWHLESECGAMFELEGSELFEIFKNYESTEEVIKEMYEDDFYRIEVSY